MRIRGVGVERVRDGGWGMTAGGRGSGPAASPICYSWFPLLFHYGSKLRYEIFLSVSWILAALSSPASRPLSPGFPRRTTRNSNLISPDIKLTEYWSHTLRQTFKGELGRAVNFYKRHSNNSKMAAVVDDQPTLPRFHARKHSLD